MKKKILLIVALLFICAGCDVKYTLTIDKDLKVKETVFATQPESFFEEYPKSSKGKVIADIVEPHLDTLNKNKYRITTSIDVNSSGVIINKDYQDLKEYSENTIFSSQFSEDKVSISEDGNIVTIKIKGKFSQSSQNQSIIPVDKAEIRLVVPFKVTEHNANTVSDNTYIWKFDEDTKEKEIKISFNKKKIEEVGQKNDYSKIILIVAAIVLVIVGYLIYNRIGKRSEKVNDI